MAACIGAGLPAAQCNSIQNTFLAPAGANGSGPIDAITGDPVDFKLESGGLKRNAARGSNFVRFDASLNKTFNIHESVKLELRFDAFNIFNHSNWGSFNSNDVLTLLPLSIDTTAGAPNADFFTCTFCQRPNGTFVGAGGRVLHLTDVQHGKISPDLTNPVFGFLGDPAAVDVNGIGARKLQASFHVRF